MSSPNRSLRSRKGSVEVTKDAACSDFASLVRESEERIKNFVKDEIAKSIQTLCNRLLTIEKNVSVMQSEFVGLDDEITKVKQVIINQQKYIETNEERIRASNLIVHNLPEVEVVSNNVSLKSDADKLALISRTTGVDLSQNDVEATYRLGKKSPNKIRPLKIVLKSKELKHKALSKRKEIANSPVIHKTFGTRIFINPDVSYLVQKELYRLRQKSKELKLKDPDCKPYIRSGVLYLDGTVIDDVKIEKQLF
jgi:hypothetical protein